MPNGKRVPSFTVINPQKAFVGGGGMEPTLIAKERIGSDDLLADFQHSLFGSQIEDLAAWAKAAQVGQKMELRAAHVAVFVFCHG
jgi:hypothetical protein